MRSLVVLVAVLVGASGCGAAGTSSPTTEGSQRTDSLPGARDGNFVLYVSNQSFETPRVDIRIEIDGRVAVDDEFEVENQHNWVEFRFALANGSHTLRAVSKTGEAEGSWRLEVTGKHWAVVDYWHYLGERKRFSFDVSNEPIAFA